MNLEAEETEKYWKSVLICPTHVRSMIRFYALIRQYPILINTSFSFTTLMKYWDSILESTETKQLLEQVFIYLFYHFFFHI